MRFGAMGHFRITHIDFINTTPLTFQATLLPEVEGETDKGKGAE